MNSVAFQAVLTVLFLCVATAEDTERVKFEGDDFIMTCPQKGRWFKNEKEVQEESVTYNRTYNSETKGLYKCSYKETVDNKEVDKMYYFYVKGKVCAGCMEVDGLVFLMVIIADVVGTVILMTIIYKCTKMKKSAKPTQTPKAAARSGGQARPATSADYEQLNPHTRSSDTYTFVNRTG